MVKRPSESSVFDRNDQKGDENRHFSSHFWLGTFGGRPKNGENVVKLVNLRRKDGRHMAVFWSNYPGW